MLRILPRALGFVLAAGAILYLFRVPLGGDLANFAAAEATGGYRRRALGLVLLAIACPTFMTALRLVRSKPDSDREEEKIGLGRPLAQAAGFTLAGAGAALALEAIARHARSLVTTAPIDFTILGAVLLALGFFGALAFAPLFEGERKRVLAVSLGSLACALLCVITLRTLNGLATPQGFRAYVSQFDLGASQRGFFLYSALLGGTLFALPAFAIGTAAASTRRRELTLLVLGGALGLLLVPRLLSSTDLADPLVPSPFSAGLVRVGILLAALGAAIALASSTEAKGKTRLAGFAVAAAGLAGAFLLPIRPIVIVGPWQVRPPQLRLVIDAPEGLLVVDGGGQGFAHASIDGRPLTPNLGDAGLDAAIMETSVALLPKEVLARELRVLLLGVLTPGRALALGSGATIDRTTSFHSLVPDLEKALFGAGAFPEHEQGDVIAPEVAKERVAAGRYDLVLAPPVFAGPVPTVPFLNTSMAPETTTLAVWFDASNSLVGSSSVGLSSEARAVLASDGLERFAVGVVRGPAVRDYGDEPESYGSEPRTFSMGAAVDSPLLETWLSTRTHRKGRICADLLARRLKQANRGKAGDKIARAIARATAIQHESSQFADEAASTEIDEQVLTLLREAALQHTPDLFTARFIERIGKTLLGKGWINETHELLEPIAARYAPRPELETLLAQAEIDGLLFDDALARLDRINAPENGDRAILRARALTRMGRPADALPILRRVKQEGLVAQRTARLELAATLAELDPAAALAELEELGDLIGHDDELERIEDELRARFALEGVEVPEHDHSGHDH